MNHSAASTSDEPSERAALRTTRMSPSVAKPEYGSQSALTVAAVSSSSPSGSRSSTKSFWVPWPLVKGISRVTATRLGRRRRPGAGPAAPAGGGGGGGRHPTPPPVAPEPGLLAAGEPAGGRDRLLDRVLL